MPELPEIAVFATDMQRELPGRTIADIEVVQPKCLNLPEALIDVSSDRRRQHFISLDNPIWIDNKSSSGLNTGIFVINIIDLSHLPAGVRQHGKGDTPFHHF